MNASRTLLPVATLWLLAALPTAGQAPSLRASGSIEAAAFVGDGSQLTNLDADTVGGVDVVAALALWQQCQGDRLFDQGDGTVFDCWTGLYLLADASCFAAQPWPDAMLAAAELGDSGTLQTTDDCGLADGSARGEWRLATHIEWLRIIGFAAANVCSPSLTDDSGRLCADDPGAVSSFSGVLSTGYWSSSQSGAFADFADLSNGTISQVAQNGAALLVWPVRDAF